MSKRMRLADWDYSCEGMYFLTICAREKKHIFSQVVGCGILDAPYVQLPEIGDSVQRAMVFLSENTEHIHLEKMDHYAESCAYSVKCEAESMLARGCVRDAASYEWCDS